MTDAEKAKLAQDVLSIQENMPSVMEVISLSARLYKAKYDSFIKEGFTPEQAIQLCNFPVHDNS